MTTENEQIDDAVKRVRNYLAQAKAAGRLDKQIGTRRARLAYLEASSYPEGEMGARRLTYDEEAATPYLELALSGDPDAIEVFAAFSKDLLERKKDIPPGLMKFIFARLDGTLKPRAEPKRKKQLHYEVALAVFDTHKMLTRKFERRFPISFNDEKRKSCSKQTASGIVEQALRELKDKDLMLDAKAIAKAFYRNKDYIEFLWANEWAWRDIVGSVPGNEAEWGPDDPRDWD